MRKAVAFFLHSTICILWGAFMVTLPDQWYYPIHFIMPVCIFIVGIWGDGAIFPPKKKN